ncbi:hypothetical protein HF918_12435 [Acidithiobacillus ferriphilus]|nr:hypothetical protein [Acidithiobacillus ferriphilus]
MANVQTIDPMISADTEMVSDTEKIGSMSTEIIIAATIRQLKRTPSNFTL